MKTVELKTASLAAFLSIIEEQPGGYRHLFRGQANAEWGLIPSLFRIRETGISAETLEKGYEFFEVKAIERFFNEGLPYLPPLARSYSNDRILAQHFGVPTRLLDWSRDPFVSAFFALENWAIEADAAIYMLLPDAQYLPEQVKSLGTHKAIAIRPPAIDRRIPAQKSMFTFHPYGVANEPFLPLNERPDMGNMISSGSTVERGFVKIVIPSRLKRYLNHTLLSIGYDRRNLFPGLDGVGADVSARALAGQMWE